MAELEAALSLTGKDGTVVQISKYSDCTDFYLTVDIAEGITSEFLSVKNLSAFAFQLNNIMKDYDA